MTEEEKKAPAAGEKGSRKRTVVIAAAIAAIVVLGGAGGGYAYAANKAYESYESQVESARAIDSKLVKKVESARQLAKATKDTDVLDKTLLDSLNTSAKAGEAQKGSPKAEDVNKWALWEVSKAKTTVADDKTRESLKAAIDTAKKTVDDKKSDVKTLNAQKDAVSKAVKSVNDSKTAKEQADAEAKAEEAARQAAQQQSQAQAQTYSNTNYNRTNSGTSTYSAPTQHAQTQQSAPQQSQNQNNSSSNSGYTKLCATFDSQGNSTYYTPCN